MEMEYPNRLESQVFVRFLRTFHNGEYVYTDALYLAQGFSGLYHHMSTE